MQQKQSFHTHTWRCGHAEGTEREYVENAIKAGMTVLGFSDHAPYVFEGDYYSNFRIRHEDIQSYFDVVGALKEEFKDKIEIHIGFEAEYYPKFFDKFLKLIEPLPVEYLLLGQHFPNSEMGEKRGNGALTDDPERLKRYVSQVCEALDTGKFNCIAHPDIIHYEGDDALYESEMLKLCEHAKKVSIPLEINLLGIRTDRHYPSEKFIRIVGAVGNDVVCGSDAHLPQDVYDQKSFDRAMEWVEKYNLKWHEASYILNGGYASK